MIRLTIEEVKKKIFETHGDTITIDISTYKNTRIKARFIDKDYGEFWASSSDIFAGKGHAKRGIQKRTKTRTLAIEEVENRIAKIHGNVIKIDKSTYINAHTKCKFIDDKYGEWWACPKDIINKKVGHPRKANDKRKQTNVKKFGVEYPAQKPEIQEKIKQVNIKKYGFPCSLQNPTIALKAAKSSNNSAILIHWFSNEEIICIASYEIAVVNYLNTNNIDYLWQVQTFTMLDNKTYRPDIYLPNEDKWIEIKGYFRDDAEEKWNWFHKEYQNSELWDKGKLKELGIL